MSTTLPLAICLLAGCASTGGGFQPPWKKTTAKVERPKDSLTLIGRTYELEPVDPKLRQELDGAERLKQEKKYGDAERIYHGLAQAAAGPNWWESMIFWDTPAETKAKSKYPRSVFEEALFGEAECQRLQKNYRDATTTYTKMLVEFPHSRFTNKSCQGLFEIADHWLIPTRNQMNEYHEQLQGKRWFVAPAMYIHFSKDMPTMDAQGHAVAILNTIRLHDINGEMAKQALLYLGTIHFYNKDYKEADFYFTDLHKHYPNAPEAAKAIKQSIICKQLMTGGSVYDLRGIEESKKLLMQAQGAYPEFSKDTDWVTKQLTSISLQQAERDFKVAEFYQRTGHPGSAYFYFELVCRRYPGSTYADKAAKRKEDLRSRAEREVRESAPQPPGVQTAPPTEPRLLPRWIPALGTKN
jgi:outer membrane protein assembly factor BamD (BamD/ComL family)